MREETEVERGGRQKEGVRREMRDAPPLRKKVGVWWWMRMADFIFGSHRGRKTAKNENACVFGLLKKEGGGGNGGFQCWRWGNVRVSEQAQQPDRPRRKRNAQGERWLEVLR